MTNTAQKALLSRVKRAYDLHNPFLLESDHMAALMAVVSEISKTPKQDARLNNPIGAIQFACKQADPHTGMAFLVAWNYGDTSMLDQWPEFTADYETARSSVDHD